MIQPGLVCAVLARSAAAAPPALSEWLASYGEPTRPVAEVAAARLDGEPLMLFWMAVEAAPLGVGPAIPGTLVANFADEAPGAALVGFTFLAAAPEPAADALVSALRDHGWVRSQQQVHREGGDFLDITVTTPDGLSGVVSRRVGIQAAAMADGRPAPTVWMSLSAVEP